MKWVNLCSVCPSDSTDCGGISVKVTKVTRQQEEGSGSSDCGSWEEESSFPIVVRQ